MEALDALAVASSPDENPLAAPSEGVVLVARLHRDELHGCLL